MASDTNRARSDLWTRVGSAIVLFAIAGTALWFGGIAFGLLLLVGGALVVVEWLALVRAMGLGGGAKAALTVLGPAAILGAIDENHSGIASAVNNAVSRVAGLLVVAMLSTIVGGTLDLDGFHNAAWFTAMLLVIGGVVSWIGIRRNPAAPAPVDAAATGPAPH